LGTSSGEEVCIVIQIMQLKHLSHVKTHSHVTVLYRNGVMRLSISENGAENLETVKQTFMVINARRTNV
jgi:hypothetical protein